MKLLLKIVLVLGVLGAACAAAYKPAMEYWKERNRPSFREVEVTRGRIASIVNATGTVRPVLSVHVGSFVSGPVDKLLVDFNDKVKEGDLLATIDPRIYDAAVARDRAILATRKAEVNRVNAQLQQARNDEQRANNLYAENEDFISESELDSFKFNRQSLEAQLVVAESAIDQSQASLENSEANLQYTQITSPVNGIVIDRKIDRGQTLASQFQTPELFIVAEDMDQEMHVFASIDEADIGMIRDAQKRGEPVQFTVDAYPDQLFEGTIFQVRISGSTSQNVVTYPVVVAAPNRDLKLLPGMTANLSFQIAQKEDVVRVPDAALRFYPETEHVRKEDHKILDGAQRDFSDEDDDEDLTDVELSASEKAEAAKKRNRRHVWVVDGEFLRAIEIEIGLNDYKNSELVSGELKEGQKLVTGLKSK